MACRGTSHQLLSMFSRMVLFGILRTRVIARKTSFDSYGAISAHDVMISSSVVR